MAASYADFNTDSATKLKRRIMQQIDPNAAATAEPMAVDTSAAAAPTEAAPFTPQPSFRAPGPGEMPPKPEPPWAVSDPRWQDPDAPGPLPPTGPQPPFPVPPPPVETPPIVPSPDPTEPDPKGGPVDIPGPVGIPDPVMAGVKERLRAASSSALTEDGSPPSDVPYTPPDPPPYVTPGTTPQAATNALPHVVTDGTPDAVKALYAELGLHAASDEEAENWLNGTYGGARTMADIRAQIMQSDEYQRAHQQSAPTTGARTDPNYIGSVVAQWMATNNPRGHQDAEYWKRRILETGGLGPDNMAYWQGRFTEAEGTHPAEAPAAPAPAGGGAPAPAAPGAAAGGSDAYSQFVAMLMQKQQEDAANKAKVRAMLMSRLEAASKPVDENDITISQPLAAARDETQRAQQTERTALAERMYAQGGGQLNSDALNQAIQQSSERNAGGLSQLRAGLITHAYEQKLSEMQQDLQLAMASGDTESAQLLQAQIAALSASVQREGLGVNLAEFMAQLNQRTALAGLNGA